MSSLSFVGDSSARAFIRIRVLYIVRVLREYKAVGVDFAASR